MKKSTKGKWTKESPCNPASCADCGKRPEYSYGSLGLASAGNVLIDSLSVNMACPECGASVEGPVRSTRNDADNAATERWNRLQRAKLLRQS